MKILPAEPEHVAEIARLAAVVWHAHYPGIISREQIDYMLSKMYDLEVMRREMAEGITYLRALEGDQLVGFASYGPADADKSVRVTGTGKEIKLHKLYVDPSRQRRGIGRVLMEHVERANRGRTLMLTVNKRNHQAIAAYQKYGFAIRDSVIVDIGGGFVMDDYVMAKAIGA